MLKTTFQRLKDLLILICNPDAGRIGFVILLKALRADFPRATTIF